MQLTNRDYAHFYFDDYDLEAQLIAIRGALASARANEADEVAEIKRLAARAETIGSDHLVGMYTDLLHASVYSDAARSASAVGMLAPFVENLFTGIFRGIGRESDAFLGRDPSARRAELAHAHFWNPQFSYDKSEVKTDLVGGIMQLADASKLAAVLPADTRQVLEALIGYRNNILHNGFEWPLERRRAFANRVANWPTGWFSSATSGGEIWVWYMTDAFIARVLAFIDEVIEAAGEHIRLRYASAGPV